MNKTWMSVYIVFVLVTAGFAGILVFEGVMDEGGAEATTTRYVGGTGPGNWSKIQDAIDNASNGDTIRVYVGIYYENVKVNRTVTLIGNGTTNTTIDGGGSGDVVHITADWVNMTGFTITNSGSYWGDSGIELNNAKNCYIYNNNVSSNNERGIFLYKYSKNNTLVNNTVNSNYDSGIYLRECRSNTLVNNTCSNNGNGIDLFISSSNTLKNNNCSNNFYGILLSSSSNRNTLENNTCSNNYNGILLSGSSNCNTLENNTCSNNADGIHLFNSSSNTLENNACSNNGADGISLGMSSNNNTLENNTCNSNNTFGIYLYESSSNTLENNNCSNNFYGISLLFSSSNTVENNTCNSNNGDGILLTSSSSNTLENNTCNSNNDYGIYLSDSSSNMLVNNTCNNNSGSGIFLSFSSENTIVNNTCSNNGVGISFEYLSNSNLIINNTCSLNSYGIWLSKSSNSNELVNNSCPSLSIGIWLSQSDGNRIVNNTCSSNWNSISLWYSINNMFYNNTLYSGGFEISGSKLSHFNTHILGTDNTVNGNPIYYWKDINGGTVPLGAGQIILANSTNVTVKNQNISDGYAGIIMGYSNNNNFFNNTCLNTYEGIYMYSSSWNMFVNNTCSNNSDGFYMFSSSNNTFVNNTCSNTGIGIYLKASNGNFIINNSYANTSIGISLIDGSSNNYLINTSKINSTYYDISLSGGSQISALNCSLNWSKIEFSPVPPKSNLTVQWYLHVYVTNQSGMPESDVKINVKDKYNDHVYNGKTDASGYCKWIICTDYIEDITGVIKTFSPYNVSASKKAFDTAYATPEPVMNASKIVNITIHDDITPPEPPTNLIFSKINGKHLNFTWTASASQDCIGYNIYVNDTGSSTNYHFLGSTENTYFNATDLVEETTYYFEVTSFDDAPWESTALQGSITTTDITPPSPPTFLSISSFAGTSIEFTWTASVSADVAGYEIYINDTGSAVNFHLLTTTTNTLYNHTNLNEEMTYYFKIRAYDEVPLHSTFTTVAFATTLDDTPPTAPTSLVATNPTGSTITLSWNQNPEGDIAGYQILKNVTGAGSSGPFHLIHTTSGTDNSYVVSGLLEETTFYFLIISFDERPNYSPLSNIASNTTLDVTAPAKPTGLAVDEVGNNWATLSWNANTDTDLLGYELFVNDTGKGVSGPYHLINSFASTLTEYDLTELAEETTYYFVLQAFDEVPQNSPNSDSVVATTIDGTPPQPPTNVAVTEPTTSSLKITWQASPDDDVEGYNLYRSLSETGGYTKVNADPISGLSYIDKDLSEQTTYFYRVTAFDEVPNESDYSAVVSGTTLLAQHPPEAKNPPGDITIVEDTVDDTSINLYDWFEDVNNDKFSFMCTGQTYIEVTIHPDNGTVVLKPMKNWNGEEILKFYVSDDVFPYVSDSVKITVTAVNDPPEKPFITKPGTGIGSHIIKIITSIEDGESLDFAATCNDPDIPYGDVLTFKWSSNISGEIGEGDSLENIILPIGYHGLILTVTDKMGKSSSASLDVIVEETLSSDSDSDGMTNIWERGHGLKPFDPSDKDIDTDNDGLSNFEEFENDIDPQDPDSDSDGLTDGDEVNTYQTRPDVPDTDSDGHNDGTDAFPLDPTKWEEESADKKDQPEDDNLMLIIIIIIVIVIVVALLVFLLVIRKKRGGEGEGAERVGEPPIEALPPQQQALPAPFTTPEQTYPQEPTPPAQITPPEEQYPPVEAPASEPEQQFLDYETSPPQEEAEAPLEEPSMGLPEETEEPTMPEDENYNEPPLMPVLAQTPAVETGQAIQPPQAPMMQPPAAVACMFCGGSNAAGVPFCAFCGQPMQAPAMPQQFQQPAPKRRFCGGCGAEVPEGKAFCGGCGKRSE